MKIRLKKRSPTRWMKMFLLVLTFSLRAFTDALYVSKEISSPLVPLKYLVLSAVIFIGIVQLNKMPIQKKHHYFLKELACVTFVAFFFVIVTLFLSLIHSKWRNTVFSDIFKLILPAVSAYVILNTYPMEDIYDSMKWILIFTFVGYVIEIGLSSFSLGNFLSINFDDSYSPFESNHAASISIALFAYFRYYQKDNLFVFLSFLFALLTFKRLFVLYAIFLLIFPMIVDVSKPAGEKIRTCMKFLFSILTPVYYFLLLPSSGRLFSRLFGVEASRLTMGRSGYLQYLLSHGFVSTGLGSTTVFSGRGLEMDIIQFLLEMSFVGVIIFIWCYWECAGNNIYTVVFMTFLFANMLTSSSISNSFSWLLYFMLIGSVTYLSDNKQIHCFRIDKGPLLRRFLKKRAFQNQKF